jgi:hypothetical protein
MNELFTVVFSDDTRIDFHAEDLATAWEMAADVSVALRKAGVSLVRPA